MSHYKHIVILTGSGISAESGLKTFRGGGGLWEGHAVEDVATPEAFARNPALVQRFYNERRAQLKTVAPNAAHLALVELEQRFKGEFLLVTQNVDDLHLRAGNKNLLAMHGELKKKRHILTHEIADCDADLSPDYIWRPHIVWFGEMPLFMDEIYDALQRADLFVAIGTSGQVYPAAGFVAEARNADTVEINLEPSGGSRLFERNVFGLATETVPAFVREIIGDSL